MNAAKPKQPIRPFVDEIYAPLPDSTRMMRRRPGWVWSTLSVPIYLLIIALGMLVILIPLFLAFFIWEDIADSTLEVASLYGLFFVILATFWWVKYVEKRPLSTIGWTGERAFVRYVRGFVFGIASVVASVGTATLLGGYSVESWAPALSAEGAVLMAVIFLFGFIIQGASEEIMSRGWQMSGLAARSGLVVAILLNAVVFALLHIFNIDTINWIAMFNLFLFGVFASFYALSQKTIVRKLFHHDAYDIDDILYDETGKDVVGVEYIANAPVRVLSDGTGGLRSVIASKYPDMIYDYIDGNATAGKFVYLVSSSSSPGLFILVDRKANTISELSDVSPQIGRGPFGKVKPISYEARDGLEIPAYVTFPPGYDENTGKKIPFIVLPHGGPSVRDSGRYDEFAQFFATRGIGVLQMNYRGSTGFGKSFTAAGRENWVLIQEDVEDGARWIREQSYVDTEQVCIGGWSFGGYAALMGAVKSPDIYACAISMAGVTDLKDMIIDRQKYLYGKSVAQNSILDGFDGKAELKENSPVKRVGEIKIPTFIAHGKVDQVVHFDQFIRMKKALRKSSADVTAVPLDNENHYLSRQKNRKEFYTKLDSFLDKHLILPE